MDIVQIRFRNFRDLLEQFKETTRKDDPAAPEKGMLKLFGDRVGVREAYMSHINTRYKGIGPATARKIEQALGLSHGWMDQVHNKKSRTSAQEDPAKSAEHLEPIDSDERTFLEASLTLYRSDPIRAQNMLIEAMSRKFKD